MHRSSERAPVTRWPSGRSELDLLAVEEPLQIRVEGQPLAVLLRTPGHDLELVAGFLLTEGLIDGPDDLAALAHVGAPDTLLHNTVDCRLASGIDPARVDARRRDRLASSGCGLCGKTTLDQLHSTVPPLDAPLPLAPHIPSAVAAALRGYQPGFGATGALHGAALFTADGALVLTREDVGRHNAIDKVLGRMLLDDRLPLSHLGLLVSSRAGYEVVQKALVARIGAVVTIGAATSLAVQVARASRMSLWGFTREDRATRYV